MNIFVFSSFNRYVAPEILVRPYSATAADIWSCGVILVAMLSGGEKRIWFIISSFLFVFRFHIGQHISLWKSDENKKKHTRRIKFLKTKCCISEL